MININDCAVKRNYRIDRAQLDHSVLAMRAARGMRRSSHKEKTGRIICRHLLDMLAENQGDMRVNRTVRRYLVTPLDLHHHYGQHVASNVVGDSANSSQNQAQTCSQHGSEDMQISLSL